MIPDYTVVTAVDARHLRQLAENWQTWRRHKPSLLERPMIVFYDKDQVSGRDVCDAVDHPDLSVFAWPMDDVDYGEAPDAAGLTARQRYDAVWTDPQRCKMLAGFVHVPAMFVNTTYWLKLDTCVRAVGQDDWIDPEWFEDQPAVVSHRWGYTKPPDQMMVLDRWVEENKNVMPAVAERPPLNLAPKPGAKHLSHRRIMSWCAFFDTEFTLWDCARSANDACGLHRLPVPSQDGFQWYMARRMGRGIVRTNMKTRGWEHRPVRDFSMGAVEENQ